MIILNYYLSERYKEANYHKSFHFIIDSKEIHDEERNHVMIVSMIIKPSRITDVNLMFDKKNYNIHKTYIQ